MLEQDEPNEEIIARVAALDIGKAEPVCCAQIPDPVVRHRLCRRRLLRIRRICCSRQPFRLIGAHRMQHSGGESLRK